MPRNSSGVYTLPGSNPVVPFTTIATSWANPTMSDIASELTNSLDRSGRGGMLAPFRIFDGTLAQPGLAFLNDPTLGLWRSGSGTIQAANAGAVMAQIDSTGVKLIDGTLAAPSLSFISEPTSGLYRHASNQLRVTVDGDLSADFLSNQLQIADGILASPSLSFISEPTSGLYRQALNHLRISIAGNLSADFLMNQFRVADGTAAAPGFAFINDSTLGFYRSNTDVMTAVVNGAAVMDIKDAAYRVQVAGPIRSTPITVGGGFPVTDATTDANVALRQTSNGNWVLDSGAASGWGWIQLRLNDAALSTSNLYLNPLGGPVVVGTTDISDTTTPLQVAGSIKQIGDSTRLTAPMSNANHTLRWGVQNSVTNGNSILGILPNGTSTIAACRVFGSSDPGTVACIQGSFAANIVTGKVNIDASPLNGGTAPDLIFTRGGAVSFAGGDANNFFAAAMQKAGLAVAADITTGYWRVVKDTSGGSVRLVYNDGGTIKSVTLT